MDLYTKNNPWRPFPAYDNRKTWGNLPEEIKIKGIQSADDAMRFNWPTLPATLYLQFSQNGNRSNYEEVYFERRKKLADLVIGELIDGKGKYLNSIVNGIWAICEETSWTIPAHIYGQKNGPSPLPEYNDNVVALFSAETGSTLAWTYYFLKDRLDSITPMISQRIVHEIEKRILDPVMERDDFWWMGIHDSFVNNWNPWIISNWITCDLIIEQDPARKAKSLEKAMTCLDNFLNQYPDDGGCNEGPGYWSVAGGSLFDCLDLLYSSSQGKIDIFSKPLIKNIGSYICKAYIAGEYFINFADASAKIHIDPDIVFRYGKMTGNPAMMGFAAYALHESGYSNNSYVMGRRLNELFSYKEIEEYTAKEPLIPDFWLPDTQVFGARSEEGSETGLYLAGKGGNNGESHNHNDVGNYIIYMNGRPAIIDVGVETYRKETFSNKRYSIWTMQSQYHNLPTVGGIMQKDGSEFKAKDVSFSANKKSVRFSLDIAGAYPEEAHINYWKRFITFIRGKSITVTEDYELTAIKDSTFISLMTPCSVDTGKKGSLVLMEENVEDPFSIIVKYDPRQLAAEVEKIGISDTRLKNAWGDHLYRIKLSVLSHALKNNVKYTIQPKE